MILKLKTPIGTMAAEVGEGAERLHVDTIAVMHGTVNLIDGFANFSLWFGGCDSNGHFHFDLKHKDEGANVHILRKPNPDDFDELFTDSVGFPRVFIPEDIMDQVTRDILVPAAYKISWGRHFPDIEVLHNGETIFSAKALREESERLRYAGVAEHVIPKFKESE